MSRKIQSQGALFVRLPAAAASKLDRAAEALRMHKKDLVAGLVSRYLDPDSERGLGAMGSLSTPSLMVGLSEPARGSYSFNPYDPPEVLNAEQAGQFLQIKTEMVIELADVGKLPGRKVAGEWRFSRTALVNWLSAMPSETR
jgi:hypothetical protein